jgi:integrase
VQKRLEEDQVDYWTIIREIGALRAALRFHDRETPARFYIPSAPAHKDRYLTKKEFMKLLEAAVEPHIRLFIIMGLCTAARKTAILQLRWDQIDFNRGIINFGKSNKYKGRRKFL